MTLPTDQQVRIEFRRIVDQRADIGAARMISNWFFEPPNIFDPKSRKRPKPEFVIVVAYVVLMTLACAAFNLG